MLTVSPSECSLMPLLPLLSDSQLPLSLSLSLTTPFRDVVTFAHTPKPGAQRCGHVCDAGVPVICRCSRLYIWCSMVRVVWSDVVSTNLARLLDIFFTVLPNALAILTPSWHGPTQFNFFLKKSSLASNARDMQPLDMPFWTCTCAL